VSPSASTAVVVSPSAVTSKAPEVSVGGDRPVTVNVPPGYDPNHPAPLLINLHGYGSNSRDNDRYMHLGDLAAERGYLYLHPDGTPDSGGDRFWNATDACCDFERTGVDDVAYLAGVIDETATKFAVDPKRIYVIGHSNGGFMSYALACAHPETIAAMASIAGANFATDGACTAKTPVAVLQIHGTADDTILYEGGTLDLGPGRATGPFPGAKASVATWATIDGCTASAVAAEQVDVATRIGTAAAPAESSVTRWTGCKPGGAAELWTIPGGDHAPALSDAFPTAVLDFFDAHPKP
jgi:polyhydroxybutyrate depolymerase